MDKKFANRLAAVSNWRPPADWDRITVVDAHTEGEPLRVVITGLPDLSGSTILQRRRYAKAYIDELRTALMWEPRGHADMYGCIITPPVNAESHFGVLFTHNEGYSTMCGHGIIGVTTVVFETGFVRAQAPESTVKIDTPAGLVTAHAQIGSGRVQSVRFHNVPSFVLALDREVQVPELGPVKFDLAFGGAFYAYVAVEQVGLHCTPAHYRGLIETGRAIKQAVAKQQEMVHPFEADLNFLYGTIFIGPAESQDAHSRNVCIFADGEVDRSPTGTGVSGRAAIHFAKGELALNESITIESIIGSRFRVKVVQTTQFGPHQAVVPEVEGRAFIIGKTEALIDPADPLKHGFFLR